MPYRYGYRGNINGQYSPKTKYGELDIPEISTDISNAFAYIKGREYARWIDKINTAGVKNRTMGDSANDLIDNPAYIIESIFRDEVWVERDLQITSTASTTTFVCDDLMSREDDHYKYAIFYNATTGVNRYITGSVGSTNTLTINSVDASMAASDNIFLINIKGDDKIDYASFDLVGDTSSGSRKNFVFGKSIFTKAPLEAMIDQICFESHCDLFESVDEDTGVPKLKLVALDAATSGDTWTKPAFINGKEVVKISLTPLNNILTSFKLRYYFDYGAQDYHKEIFVDKNGFGGAGTLAIADQLKCKKAESTSRVTNQFDYSADWIYDDTTAELMLQKKIEWFTKQRLIVDWTTGLSDGVTDYIKYERGDQIKLNYSQAIPTGINNSSFFMITSKRIITVQGAPLIQWKLMEMG